MAKEIQTGIRYVKQGRPDLVRYFTQESINLYNPERAGWVLDDGSDYSTPEDVINFMEDKQPICNSSCAAKLVEEIKAPDFSTMPTRELKEKISGFSDADLQVLLKDTRKTAVKIAQEEIARR